MTTPGYDPHQVEQPLPAASDSTGPTSEAPDDPNLEALAKQQEEYRKAYLEQLRRMSCPGCGDDGSIPM